MPVARMPAVPLSRVRRCSVGVDGRGCRRCRIGHGGAPGRGRAAVETALVRPASGWASAAAQEPSDAVAGLPGRGGERRPRAASTITLVAPAVARRSAEQHVGALVLDVGDGRRQRVRRAGGAARRELHVVVAHRDLAAGRVSMHVVAAHEARDELGARAVVDLVRRADLLDQAVVHHHHRCRPAPSPLPASA